MKQPTYEQTTSKPAPQAASVEQAIDPRQVQLDGQVGLGIDLVQIERMERILERTPSFASKVFSEAECAYCDGCASPATHYATRFAAKEAVLKALGTGFAFGIHPRDVEVIRHVGGRPTAKLSGRAEEIATQLKVVELPISLSYTHTDAVACAMAITEDSVRARIERTDPMEELSKQFKELRGMLDSIDAPEKEAPGEDASEHMQAEAH